MDWQALLSVIIVGVLFFLMMRGCGGVGRGCGMGGSRMDRHRREERDTGDMKAMDRSKMNH